MIYVFFLLLTIFYRLIKYRLEKKNFLKSLTEAHSQNHREMILGHYFYVVTFEVFLAFIIAHLLTPKSSTIGMIGLGVIYIGLIIVCFMFFKVFIKHVEKQIKVDLYHSFKTHILSDLRLNFSLVLLPVLIFSLLNFSFFEDPIYYIDGFFLLDFLLSTVSVSILTILCTAIVMLRLIPSREIIETEYLQIIQKRLLQINKPQMRFRWIEADVKNAFVVGLDLLFFRNHTLYIGKNLQELLSLEEFDAVIAHELSHVVRRHMHSRLLGLLKNFILIIFGMISIFILFFSFIFLLGDEASTYLSDLLIFLCVVSFLLWFVFNHYLLFQLYQSQEYEADGFAVLELGADAEAFKSAIRKLSQKDQVPEYFLKSKHRKGNTFSRWLSTHFSSHPPVEKRISFIEKKINLGLSFDDHFYESSRINWNLLKNPGWGISKIFLALTCIFFITISFRIKSGIEKVTFVSTRNREEILKRPDLVMAVNSRPFIFGNTLMYYIVSKKDKNLISHFINNGADQKKTLIYLSQTKDFHLFHFYFLQLENTLSLKDYEAVCRKSAKMNFMEGYELLIKSPKFAQLSLSKRNDLISFRNNVSRVPASK
jgi:Zn-dependent protease with chaperone function